jgi:hypothetical protein
MNPGDHVRLSEFAVRKRRNQEMVARHGPEELFRIVATKSGACLDLDSSTGIRYYDIPTTDVGTVIPPRVPVSV